VTAVANATHPRRSLGDRNWRSFSGHAAENERQNATAPCPATNRRSFSGHTAENERQNDG
jgi:hypothetical protein